MNLLAVHEDPIEVLGVHMRDLQADHSLFRRLLNRFEQIELPMVRRDIMQLMMDLFDLHSAIEGMIFPAARQLIKEREAVYDLMEQVEGTDSRSQLHFARGLELKRVFEAYIDREDSLVRRPKSVHLKKTPGNRSLLEERALLVNHAEKLLSLH